MKPCPFCGSYNTKLNWFPMGHLKAVLCNDCKAQGPWVDDLSPAAAEQKAVKAWNERAEPATPKTNEVFSHPDCVFHFCPTPALCKEKGCQNKMDQKP